MPRQFTHPYFTHKPPCQSAHASTAHRNSTSLDMSLQGPKCFAPGIRRSSDGWRSEEISYHNKRSKCVCTSLNERMAKYASELRGARREWWQPPRLVDEPNSCKRVAEVTADRLFLRTLAARELHWRPPAVGLVCALASGLRMPWARWTFPAEPWPRLHTLSTDSGLPVKINAWLV